MRVSRALKSRFPLLPNQRLSQRPMLPILLVLALMGPLLCGGCSMFHRKSSSYNRMIPEGDPNPTIREEPQRAGEIIRKADTPRGQGDTSRPSY